MRSKRSYKISSRAASARTKKAWQTRRAKLSHASVHKQAAFGAGVAFTTGAARNIYSIKRSGGTAHKGTGTRSTNPYVLAGAAAAAAYGRHYYNKRQAEKRKA